MTVEIVVPQIGEAVSELMLTQWLKQVGDEVEKGDVLFEVDSDKAIVEVEAFTDGTLVKIIHGDGSPVMPQQVVGILQTEDESNIAPPTVERSPSPVEAEPITSVKASPVAERIARAEGIELESVTGTGPRGRIMADDVRTAATRAEQPQMDTRNRINASPKTKRIARENNIDLKEIFGTGIDGMIITADLETALTRDTTSLNQTKQTRFEPDDNVYAFGKLRRRIAERMTDSKQQVPHFYLMVDVNVHAIDQLRTSCTNVLGWERAPTYTDIIVRAAALTLAEMPDMNRSFKGGGYIERDTVGVGVAVSTDMGLVVPVLPEADSLSLEETSNALRGLVKRTRDGRLKPADLGEKSISVSNLGMYGIDRFIAIIDMPDPMILAVGQVSDQVVPVDGRPEIRPLMTLTLSVDHRVFDGTDGARVLSRLKDRLENPFDILR